MMIVLIRHIKSDWGDFSQPDFERTIQNSRKKDLLKVLDYLKTKEFYPDEIYCSAAKRTRQTAKAACEYLGFPYSEVIKTEAIYECTATELYNFIKENLKPSEKTIFIIGHNPSISDFATQYLQKEIDNVPTSGTIAFSVNRNWEMKFELFAYPKQF